MHLNGCQNILGSPNNKGWEYLATLQFYLNANLYVYRHVEGVATSPTLIAHS
jgi:hypothetical protein